MRRCPSTMLAPEEFSGGRRVPCTGRKNAMGHVVGGCGEPCSYVMEANVPMPPPVWTFHVTYFPDKWACEYPGRRTYDVWQSAQHAWESKMDTDGFRVKIRVYAK